MANEAFARVKIDQLLKDAGWKLTDGISVRFEYPLDDGGKADYALFDRQGRALAVLEAKSTSVNLSAGEAQGRRYADQRGSLGPRQGSGRPLPQGRYRLQPGRPDAPQEALLRVLFATFQHRAKNDTGRPIFHGSAFVGRIEHLLPETARALADDFFIALYEATRMRAATPA